MKKSRLLMFLTILIVVVMMLANVIPVSADRGDIYVEIVVKSFDGSKGMPGLDVTYFNKTMVTSRRGQCKFTLKGLADNEMDFFSVYDKSLNYYGGAATELLLVEHTDFDVRYGGNPGVFEMSIFYTENTDGIIINTILTQAGYLEIMHVDFDERKDNNPQPEPPHEEPPHEEPPQEEPHEEFNPNEPEFEHSEPKRPMFRIDPLVIGLIAGLVVLVVLVIILLVRNSKNKKIIKDKDIKVDKE